jgi:signal transduction histidine kinase
MGSHWEEIGGAGLQFFGKMSASISHEIKNALAIINENAGLLGDLALMAEKGMPIDPERLKALAGRVAGQIKRADGIVKNFNRFAHSADDSLTKVDLGEILELIAELAGRHASMRGVTLEPRPSASPVMITTSPFFFENLLWLCLDFAMEVTGGGKTVGLIPEKTENGARIKLTGLEALAEDTTDTFPGEGEKALLGVLKAELAADVEAGEVIITLPGKLGMK